MKLIIDIHEKDYQSILNSGQVPYSVVYAIMNGKPLPKGHGDLKDVDAIHEEIYRLQSGIAKNGGAVIINRDQYKGLCYARGIINEAPVIIGADKEDDDEE